MANFRVAKDGYDAITDSVEHMLIDSNYQTLLTAFSASGSVNVPGTPLPSQSYSYALALGSSLGFVPYALFWTTTYGNPSGQYFFAPTTQPGNFLEDFIPGDPWYYYYLPGPGNIAWTANYMYYITYLPSQGSMSTASHPLPSSGFISVSTESGDALSDSIENLAFTSAANTVHIPNSASYTLNATVGAGLNHLFTFAHGLGVVYPFNGAIKNYPYNGGLYNFNFNTTANIGDKISMDTTNFYYNYYNNSASSVTINATVNVHYLKSS